MGSQRAGTILWSAIAISVLVLTSAVIVAQGTGKEAPAGAASTYVPPRTPDGQPDISGMWEPGPGRPMEKQRGQPWKPPAGTSGQNGAAYTFFAPGTELPGGRSTDRSPMIFDPADGIIPLQPWAVTKRDEIIAH